MPGKLPNLPTQVKQDWVRTYIGETLAVTRGRAAPHMRRTIR
jgi:hypothetical protein